MKAPEKGETSRPNRQSGMADLLGACSPEPEFLINLAFHQTKGSVVLGRW